jgi:hypothetical protein
MLATSSGRDRRAPVTLRLRVRRSTARDYRRLEAIFLRHRVPSSTATFFGFLCASFNETWRLWPNDVAYRPIYERDLFECQSPVCGRRDVTPHHLRFRSAGGDDSDGNITSLCTWCHLEGIHGGHISAEPPARAIRWTLGRTAHTVVEGRRRSRPLDAVADADWNSRVLLAEPLAAIRLPSR